MNAPLSRHEQNFEELKILKRKDLERCLAGLQLCRKGLCQADSAIQMKEFKCPLLSVLHKIILQLFTLLEVIFQKFNAQKMLEQDIVKRISKKQKVITEKTNSNINPNKNEYPNHFHGCRKRV